MEAGEYRLTRGTCFVARRLEVVAVAGLLWTSWCFGRSGIFHVFLFSDFFIFFERTRPAASMRPPCLIYLSSGMKHVWCFILPARGIPCVNVFEDHQLAHDPDELEVEAYRRASPSFDIIGF